MYEEVFSRTDEWQDVMDPQNDFRTNHEPMGVLVHNSLLKFATVLCHTQLRARCCFSLTELCGVLHAS